METESSQQRRKFYAQFLKPHERRQSASWMFQVVARRKYFPELQKSSMQSFRETLNAETMTETRFLNLLDLMEYKAKLWVDNKTGRTMPPEACVYYMTANALDEKKAFFMHYENMSKQVREMAINSGSNRNDNKGDTISNVPSVISDYKSCLEKSPYREFVKLDVDTKDPKFLKELVSILKENNIEVEHTVETRGGYHVLIRCGKDLRQLYKLHNSVVKEFGKEDAWFTIEPPNTSPRLAVPGMYQSNFLPQLVDEIKFDG